MGIVRIFRAGIQVYHARNNSTLETIVQASPQKFFDNARSQIIAF